MSLEGGEEMAKGFRNLNRAKPQNYGIGFLAVVGLVALTYVTMSRTTGMRFSVGKSLLLWSARFAVSSSRLLLAYRSSSNFAASTVVERELHLHEMRIFWG